MSEEQLSPEEKLLKVIQDGGGESEPSEPEPVAVDLSEAEAPTLEAAPAVKLEVAEEPVPSSASENLEEKSTAPAEQKAETTVSPVADAADAPALKIPPKARPKLKLSGTKAQKTATKKPPVRKAEAPQIQPASTGGMIEAGPLARVGKKGGRKKGGIALVNRALVAAALILVGLTGWEVWGSMQEEGGSLLRGDPEGQPAGSQNGDPTVPPAQPHGKGLVALDNVLKIFGQRPILMPPPKRAATTTTRTVTTVVQKSNWEIYARSNLKLKGLSVLDLEEGTVEAILADSKSGKLFFLKKGDEILLDKKKITVEAVDKDQLILTDGVKKIGLK